MNSPKPQNPAPPGVLDGAILLLIMALVLFCPLALGAYARGTALWWAEEVFIAAAGLIGGLTALRLLTSRVPLLEAHRWPLLLVAGFVLLILAQLLPAPWLTRILSPAAARVTDELLQGVHPTGVIDSSIRTTMYPAETVRHLGLLLAVTAIFVTTLVLTRSRRLMRWILRGVALAGLVVGLIALLHQALGWQRIYNLIPSPLGEARTAPLVNHSHFAQFMNLSIGASLALIFGAIAQISHERRSGERPRTLNLLRTADVVPLILPALALVVCVVGVVRSSSRGGMISLALAAIIVASLCLCRRPLRAAGAIALTLVLIGGLAVASTQRVQQRFAELGRSTSGSSRIELLRAQAPIWRQFPAVGTGLGTFEWVFARYDITHPINIASHAENEYAQLMTETGAVGLVIAVAFIALVIVAALRAFFRGGRRGAKVLGLSFGLIAILVHSLGDFGQHLPANAIVTAVVCACILNCAKGSPNGQEQQGEAPETTGLRRWLPAGGMLAVTVALFWATWSTDRSRRAAAGLTAAAGAPAIEEAARQAVRLRPGDVGHLYRLALHLAQNGGDPRETTEILARAALACPTYGPVYSLLGQSLLARDDAAAENLLRRAALLAPQDGTTSLILGEMLLRRLEDDEALRYLRHAATTAAIGHGDVLRILVVDFDRVDLAFRYAQDQREALGVIAVLLEQRGLRVEAAAAREAWLTALETEVSRPNPPFASLRMMADHLVRQKRGLEAAEYMRRAVSDPAAPREWRLDLARLLASENQLLPAIAELQRALDERPVWPEAQALLSDLQARAMRGPG